MMEVSFVNMINGMIEFYQSHWNAIDIILMVAYTVFSAYTFVAEKPGRVRTIIALPGMLLLTLVLWASIRLTESPIRKD